ncbi:MAG: hypothetical protein PHN38_00290 [Sulfurospirillaceae bacterium]|nr:hypothetical protein [Sulfurospirillaceae bacterium]
MINKFFNSLFIGFVLVLVMDFLYFMGLKLNYFDAYGVDEYFNTLFVDNQNYLIFFLLALIVGYGILYVPFNKFFAKVYLAVLILFFGMFYAPVGKYAGEQQFLVENVRFKVGSTAFSGNLIYEGRKFVYIWRIDIDKKVKLEKTKVAIEIQ